MRNYYAINQQRKNKRNLYKVYFNKEKYIEDEKKKISIRMQL